MSVDNSADESAIMKNVIRKNQIDEVTGLLNMMYFMEDSYYLLKDAGNGDIAFLYFDVENFKGYNRKYGFQDGNKFLRRIAGILRDAFPHGILARLNDDHFVAAVENENIEHRIEYVRQAVHDFDQNLALEVKVGIYVPAAGIQDTALILDRAKLACESVKGTYDKGWGVFDEALEKKIRIKNYIVSNFYRALEHHDIEVWYQPEIRTMTRQVMGFEALARWNSPEYGMISPGVFIEVLEDAHLIHKLDLYVIREACEDFRRVREHGEGWQEARISLNLSRMDFQLTDIFADVERIRQEYQVSCDRLHIEITEGAFSVDDDHIIKQIMRFREAGYEVWMDDFGSGYSSLNTLKDYDVDLIKFDMRFLRDFGKNHKTEVILKSLVSMAKELGIHTLAEGVETEEQYQFLKDIGCELCQGYLFGKPQPLRLAAASYAGSEATLSFEPLISSDYFRKIGNINLLSISPLLSFEERRNYISATPMAICEQGESLSSFRYIYTNQAYLDFVKNQGFESLEAEIQYYQQGKEHFQRMFARLLNRCRSLRKELSVDFTMNGKMCNISCRYIASNPDKKVDAFVFVIVMLSAENPQTVDFHTALRHIMGIFSRVDFFSIDGHAENIYIDENQNRITCENPTVEGSLKLYAERYIVAEERELFMRFYDLPSLIERQKEINRDHFTAFFHTYNDDGKVSLKIYIIIPFLLGGGECWLSCVKEMDGRSQLTQISPGEVKD